MIVKTFALSTIIYVSYIVNPPEQDLKRMQKLIDTFVSKHYIMTRSLQARQVEDGGLSLPLVRDIVTNIKAQWLRRMSEPRDLFWQKILRKRIINSKWLGTTKRGRGTTSPDEIPTIADFFKKFSEIQDDQKLPLTGNTRLFGNDLLNIHAGDFSRCAAAGITRLGNITRQGTLLHADEIVHLWGLQGLLGKLEVKRLVSLVERRNINTLNSDFIHKDDPIGIVPSGGGMIDFRLLRVKKLSRLKAEVLKGEPTSGMNTIITRWNVTNDDILMLLRKRKKISQWSKIQSFMIRFLHNSIPSGERLVRMGLETDSNCKFCTHTNSHTHAYHLCTATREITGWLESTLDVSYSSNESILLGITNDSQSRKMIWHRNYFIHLTNYTNMRRNLTSFKSWMKRCFAFEYSISKRKGRERFCLSTWQGIFDENDLN